MCLRRPRRPDQPAMSLSDGSDHLLHIKVLQVCQGSCFELCSRAPTLWRRACSWGSTSALEKNVQAGSAMEGRWRTPQSGHQYPQSGCDDIMQHWVLDLMWRATRLLVLDLANCKEILMLNNFERPVIRRGRAVAEHRRHGYWADGASPVGEEDSCYEK